MEKDVCPYCGKKITKDVKECPHCKKTIGMKWYKFIIWIQLIIMIIYFLWLGIAYLRGTIYGLNGEVAKSIELYETYSFLKIVDLIHGVVLIGFAIISYFIRKGLVDRKHNGPKNYLIYLIIVFLEPVIYRIFVAIATNANIIGSTLSSMYMTFIIFVISMIYFKKRAYYFNK